MGRTIGAGQMAFVEYLKASFAKDGYRVPTLLRRIATSDALYAVSVPVQIPPVQSVSAAIEIAPVQKESLP